MSSKQSYLLVLLSLAASNIYTANSYTLTASVLSQKGFTIHSNDIDIDDKNIDKIDANSLNGYDFILGFRIRSGIKTVDVHAFERLSYLDYLILENNSISSFEYLQIPKNLQDLHLGWNNMNYFALSRTMGVLNVLSICNNRFRSFKSMNFTFLANLTHLYLNDNPHAYPNEIPGHLKPLVNLEYLDLSNLSINSIDSNYFKTNTKLIWIKLASNKISSLDSKAFNGLPFLQYIFLPNNNLTQIATGTFQIGIVDLRNNQISQLDNSSFICKFPMQVNLSYNNIKNLSGAFSNRFSSIDLSYNQITELDSLTFAGATEISSLTLSNNKIGKIAPGSFSTLDIGTLNLDDNLLTGLSNMTFVGQNKFTDISLRNNKLSTIESGSFANLPNLVNVFLDNNQLTQLDSSMFAGSNNLQSISLTGNPNLSTTNIQSLCPSAATSCKVYY